MSELHGPSSEGSVGLAPPPLDAPVPAPPPPTRRSGKRTLVVVAVVVALVAATAATAAILGDDDSPEGGPAIDADQASPSGSAEAHDEHATSGSGATGDGCWPMATPLGGIPPQLPMLCEDLVSAPSTFVQGDNSWLDDFDQPTQMAALGDGYVAFERVLGVERSVTFRHNEHWMVDVGDEGDSVGGSVMRPDRTFRFEDGKLVIEAEVAAAITEYGGNAWPEITVTTAPEPTGIVNDSLYAYGQFGGHHTVGIRLHGQTPIAALYDDTGHDAGSGGRTFEISWFQHEGAASVYGGSPANELANVGRTCTGEDPDTECRDLFRWELSKDTITLFVNGTKFMEHKGLPADKQLPDELVNGDVYVYFGSWTYLQPNTTVRFHWDRLAINPS